MAKIINLAEYKSHRCYKPFKLPGGRTATVGLQGEMQILPLRDIEVDHKKRVISTDQGGHLRFNGQKEK